MKFFKVGIYNSFYTYIYITNSNQLSTKGSYIHANSNERFLKIFYKQILHVQFSPFHYFTNLLNFVVDGELFILLVRLFQMMLPLKANEPVPYEDVFVCGSINSEPDLRFYDCSFRLKVFHMKDGFSHDRHSYISVIRLLRFLTWTLTSPIFRRSSSNLEV